MKDMFLQPHGTLSAKNPASILPPATLAALKTLEKKKIYPEGYAFFVQGQSATGIYVLHVGRVQISLDNEGGKLLLGSALPGDILGLSAVVSGKCYEDTALAAVPCQAGFISCKEFLRFLEQHPEAAFWIVQLLSKRVAAAFEHLSSFQGLPCRKMTQ